MKSNLAASKISRKCLDQTVLAPTPAPTENDGGHVHSADTVDYDGFFEASVKAAGFTNKEVSFDLRISETFLKMCKRGERIDPFLRARRAVEMFRKRSRGDMIPSILIYIAGGYDGAVLSGEQFEALKVLVKAVK
jgi:hypothetical protein